MGGIQELGISLGITGRAAHEQPRQKMHQIPQLSILNKSVFASIFLTPSPPVSLHAQDLDSGASEG